MNIIKLMGGLANQLFQYAFGKAMMVNGREVYFDTSWYRGSKKDRPYELNKFYTTVNTIKAFNQRYPIVDEVALKYEVDMNYLTTNNKNFWGYWQHPAYFKHLKPVLADEFRVRKELYTPEFIDMRAEIICNENVSVHVRRGDYVRVNGHYLLTMEYFEKAINLLRDHGRIYVFSDDLTWCRRNFNGCKFVDMNPYFSFELMRLCKHNIISNSTFSWFAAYLNDNPDKQVITPNRWRVDMNDSAERDAEFKQPEQGWTVLNSPGIIVDNN